MPQRDFYFVTGASGFVGGAVVRLLASQGRPVRAFVRPTSRRDNIPASVEIAEGDMTDADSVRKAMAGAQFVFHVAANYRLWTPDPNRLQRENVEGARVVMQEALRAGVERVVHTSSVATLAPDGVGLCDETRRLDPEKAFGAYKRSKIFCEQLIDAMVADHRLPAVIVNPSAPLGPGDLKPTPTGRIIQEAARGRIPAVVDTGLDVVHVDDVAMGHLAALERGAIGERYILGGDNIQLLTILSEVARLVGRPPPRMKLPRAPLYPLAFCNELLARITGREPLLNIDSLRLSATRMFFDDRKARRELGYSSRPCGEAIADAVRWFGGERSSRAIDEPPAAPLSERQQASG